MDVHQLVTLDNPITALHHRDDVVFVGTAKGEVFKYDLVLVDEGSPDLEPEMTSSAPSETPHESLPESSYRLELSHSLNLQSVGGGLFKSVLSTLGSSQKILKILDDPVAGLVFIQLNNSLKVYNESLSDEPYEIREANRINSFVLDEHIGDSHRFTLLVSIDTRLLFVHYTPAGYTIIRKNTLHLPVKPTSFRWSGTTLLLGLGMGSMSKYYQIDLAEAQSQPKEIAPCSGSGPYMVMLDDEILLRLAAMVVFLNLQKRSDGVQIGLMNRSTVHFSAEPVQMATKFPYIVGLIFDKKELHIEVKNLYDRATESFTFPGTATSRSHGSLFTTSNQSRTKGLFLASDRNRTLYVLTPIPYRIQIRNLLRKGSCDEAFELFDKTFEGSTEKKAWARMRLCEQAGYSCLMHVEFEEAYKYFGRVVADVDIRELMDFHSVDWEEGVPTQLIRNGILRKDETEEEDEEEGEQSTVGELEKRKKWKHGFHKHRNSFRTILRKSVSGSVDRSRRDDQRDATGRRHGQSRRERDQLTVEFDRQWSQALRFLLDFLKKRRNPDYGWDLENVVIDNAIVKILIDYDINQCEDFLGMHNFVARDMISFIQRLEEGFLVPLLLRSRGDHLAALDELKKMMERTTDEYYEKKVVKETVDVLRKLDDPAMEEVILGHASWIFDAALEKYKDVRHNPTPEAIYKTFLLHGVSIFQARRDHQLKPVRVLRFFKDKLQNYVELYEKYLLMFLEHVIEQNDDLSELYHDEIAKLYIHLIESQMELNHVEVGLVPGTEGGDIAGYRERLLHHLEHSDSYNFEAILDRLKPARLYHEQCVVYKKLHQHDQALHILIVQLRQFDVAEKYCAGDKAAKAPLQYREEFKRELSPAFLALLRICVRHRRILLGPRDEFKLIPFAVSILNRYAYFIDVVEALKILPDDLTLSELRPFLDKSMRLDNSHRKSSQIHRGLWKTRYWSTKAQLVRLRKPFFLHETDQSLVCRKCNRPIADGKFICVYPNRIIVHANCRYKKNPSIEPITHRNFKLDPVEV